MDHRNPERPKPVICSAFAIGGEFLGRHPADFVVETG
jgi:hypothetical protein